MSSAQGRTWITGTVLLVLAILGVTYALGVSPRLSDASTLNAEAESVEGQNLVLEQQVQSMAALFAQIEDFRAETAALRVHVPETPDMARINQEHADNATAAGVAIIERTVGDAVVVVDPAATAEPAVVVSDGAAEGEGGETSDEAAQEPVIPAVPAASEDLFFAVPLEVRVVGPFDSVMSFLASEQAATRVRLVSGVELMRQDERPASEGVVGTANGDVELLVKEYAYVLKRPAVDQPQEGDETVAGPSLQDPAVPLAPFVPRQY